MILSVCVAIYLSFNRSLGKIYRNEERILRSFVRTVGDISVASVSHDACEAFCRGSGPATRYTSRKHDTLRSLFIFLVTRGHLTTSPLPERCRVLPRTFKPYIYSQDEIQRLLDATSQPKKVHSFLQHTTFRTLLLLLYGAGLRPSEGLRLRCCDVDLEDCVLTIWDTKCFKSRLVPFGSALAQELKSYRRQRQRLPFPNAEGSAFFATRTGNRLSYDRFSKVFRQLRTRAGIRRPETDRYQPRPHDLRHAFAVHRLTSWYQEGADVQTLLPLLSTYLGHVSVEATHVYLTMTPELLHEALLRFEQYMNNEKENAHD